ncbi:MAG: DUF2306 domain-containing protein [Microbacteriaceae bacterium]
MTTNALPSNAGPVAGIMALGLLPIVAPPFQLTSLVTGLPVAEYSARFAVSPLPLALHILGAILFCILGALQFLPRLRNTRPRFHRYSGRAVVPAGLAVAVSGVWMTLSNPAPSVDGVALFAMRLFFATAMALFLVLGLVAARRRIFDRHRDWMTRGYAVGIAAGTQLITTVPVALLFGPLGENLRAALMGAGWVITIAVAEWIIRRPVPGTPPDRESERERAFA